MASSSSSSSSPSITFIEPEKHTLPNQATVLKYKATKASTAAGGATTPFTFREAYEAFANPSGHASFLEAFFTCLQSSRLSTYSLEFPLVKSKEVDTKQFEFVLIGSPTTPEPPSPNPFQSQFDANPNSEVIPFLDAQGSAIIITLRPLPTIDSKAYLNLGTLVSQAMAGGGGNSPLLNQATGLFEQVAFQFTNAIQQGRNLFVSTSDATPNWLHFRLEQAAPYYKWSEYKQEQSVASTPAPAPSPASFSSFFGGGGAATTSSTTTIPTSNTTTTTTTGGGGGELSHKRSSPADGIPAPAPSFSLSSDLPPLVPITTTSTSSSTFSFSSSASTTTTTATTTSSRTSLLPTSATSAATSGGFGASTLLSSTTTAQQQQQQQGPGVFPLLDQTEEGRRFKAEFQHMSLSRIHAELVGMYKEDRDRHLLSQDTLDDVQDQVDAATASCIELAEMTNNLQEEWDGVIRDVTYVEGKQAVIERELTELEALVTSAAYRASQAMDSSTEERSLLYKGAVIVDDRLNRVVGAIKDLSGRFGGFLERRLSDDGAASQVVRIVNAHQHSLEWAQRTSLELEQHTKELEWQFRTTARLPSITTLPPSGPSTFLGGGKNTAQFLPASASNGNGGGGGGGGATNQQQQQQLLQAR